MITNLRVKNLKAWGEQLWESGFDLAPVTLLLGPNSAGKTSLLQAPLLLKQTLDRPEPSHPLNVGGHAGDLVDVGPWETLIHDHDVGRELGLGLSVPDGDGGTVALAAAFGLDGDVPVLRTLSGSGVTGMEPSERVQSELARLAYLGPLRLPPERRYPGDGPKPSEVGRFGEHAIPLLIAHDQAEGGRSGLLDQVASWLARLGVADDLHLVRQGDQVEALVERDGRRANLKDVGFGVSQVLPLLVLAHTVPAGTMIVVEQPDTHLHPRSQGGLAELLVAMARQREVQFLVETHSEYVFRRLQTLVAEEALSPAACRFYLAERDEVGAAGLVRLQVDEFGRVANWPQHLFGDTVGETERRTRRMLERLAQRQEPPS